MLTDAISKSSKRRHTGWDLQELPQFETSKRSLFLRTCTRFGLKLVFRQRDEKRSSSQRSKTSSTSTTRTRFRCSIWLNVHPASMQHTPRSHLQRPLLQAKSLRSVSLNQWSNRSTYSARMECQRVQLYQLTASLTWLHLTSASQDHVRYSTTQLIGTKLTTRKGT